MNYKKIGLRLIASPFILGILIISYTYGMLNHFVKYIWWGGEWITYNKNDTKRMKEIFEYLKDNV